MDEPTNERLRELRNRLERGDYEVDAEAVAVAVLERLVEGRILNR